MNIGTKKIAKIMAMVCKVILEIRFADKVHFVCAIVTFFELFTLPTNDAEPGERQNRKT